MATLRKLKWHHLALYVGLPIGLIAGSALIARALDTSWIAPSAPLSSEKLKANLEEIGTRLAALESKDAALESRVNSLESANCPSGYSQDTSVTFTLCKKTLEDKSVDEMVKVGDFWIDRYEAASCGGSLGSVTGTDTTAVACSTAGVMPQANITWFQGAQMCANAGKRICSNAEWQTAVAGTLDPGENIGLGGACLTKSETGTGRMTGQGIQCRSRFGAEDMIGNYEEWVGDWYVAGKPWMSNDFELATPWPGTDYGNDLTRNVNGTALSTNGPTNGLPAAGQRGGSWYHGINAGAFDLILNNAPSFQNNAIAVRCCAGR